MKYHPAIITTALCILSGSAMAHQYGNSSVQIIKATDLNKLQSNVPGSPHKHVRQRMEYGKGYRYGHSVDGKMGDITIWSAEPYKAYNSPSSMKSPRPRRPRTETMVAPDLEYRPEYGKTTKPDYAK